MTNTIAKRQNGKASVGFGDVVNDLFQNNLRRFFDNNFWENDLSALQTSVPVNIKETDQQYEMDVIAPGCRKEDFRIMIENNLLTVAFEHKKENEDKDEQKGWSRKEYHLQSFSRSFTLDDTVDVNAIGATYSDGILRVVLPKNEKAKKISRSISVQ